MNLKMISSIVVLAFFTQFAPFSAFACPNDRYESNDREICSTYCTCGNGSCGCCKTTCHDRNPTSSSSSGSSSGSSVGPISVLGLLLFVGIMAYVIYDAKKQDNASSSSPSIRPMRGLGIAF